MCETSNRPAAVRTAMCSAVMPEYSTRHVPAAKRDHASAKSNMRSVERGFLERCAGISH